MPLKPLTVYERHSWQYRQAMIIELVNRVNAITTGGAVLTGPTNALEIESNGLKVIIETSE